MVVLVLVLLVLVGQLRQHYAIVQHYRLMPSVVVVWQLRAPQGGSRPPAQCSQALRTQCAQLLLAYSSPLFDVTFENWHLWCQLLLFFLWAFLIKSWPTDWLVSGEKHEPWYYLNIGLYPTLSNYCPHQDTVLLNVTAILPMCWVFGYFQSITWSSGKAHYKNHITA